MNRFLLMSMSSVVVMMGTLSVSFADTATIPHPATKKAVAAVAKAAPVKAAVKAAAPAVASPSALQAAAMSGAGRSPASVVGAGSGSGNSKDISEELKIMGQSRNLSMGLLFKNDKDKLTFGTPRTNYEDKVSDKKANF
jgi:hypothetical protein